MDVIEVFIAFLFLWRHWKNTNTAVERLVLSIYWCTVVAAADAQAPATHRVNIDTQKVFFMLQPNVREEVVWVWGLTQSDLECFIHLLWASDFTPLKRRWLASSCHLSGSLGVRWHHTGKALCPPRCQGSASWHTEQTPPDWVVESF